MAALALAIDESEPEGVLDLSDEPVLGYRERMELVGVTLARGLPYLGGDFRLDPPPIEGPPLQVPTLAVVDREANREDGHLGSPRASCRSAGPGSVTVAMGRGGPSSRRSRRPGPSISPNCWSWSDQGARGVRLPGGRLTTGVTTIGARRAGGGLAGAPYATNQGGRRARRRAWGRRRESGGERLGRSVGAMGRREPRGSRRRPRRGSGGIPRTVPALAVGPVGRHHGFQPTCWARTPPPRSAPTSAATWVIRGRSSPTSSRFHWKM